MEASFAWYADPLTITDMEPPVELGAKGGTSGGGRPDAAATGSDPAPQTRLAIRPPRGWQRALDVAILATKAATLVPSAKSTSG